MHGTVLKLNVLVSDQRAKLSNLLYESRHLFCVAVQCFTKNTNVQCDSIDMVTCILLLFITKQLCTKFNNQMDATQQARIVTTSIQHHICLTNLLKKRQTNITQLNIKCLCCCSTHVLLVAESSLKRMLLNPFFSSGELFRALL